MPTWFRRVKLAMENIGVYGPGTTKDDDDEEDRGGGEHSQPREQRLGWRAAAAAHPGEWMASDDGFRYPPSTSQRSTDDEERFFDWLSNRRSLNKPIVEAMGL